MSSLGVDVESVVRDSKGFCELCHGHCCSSSSQFFSLAAAEAARIAKDRSEREAAAIVSCSNASCGGKCVGEACKASSVDDGERFDRRGSLILLAGGCRLCGDLEGEGDGARSW